MTTPVSPVWPIFAIRTDFMKEGTAYRTIKRSDYKAYPWRLDSLRLRFEVDRRLTTVTSEIRFLRADGTDSPADIILEGVDLELVSVSLDGRQLASEEFSVSGEQLRVYRAPTACVLATTVNIRPEKNTALEGLYPSGAFLLTQCEAEGFRKITYFPDRPDVLTRYDVTIVADRSVFPVLLSNGNLAGAGDLEDGRHWTRWVDPFRKPSYLFALVAGDLAFIENHFITRSGRQVALRVYVEKQNLDKCEFAMESLIKAMRWDEDRFGLEYDLDIYNIVATDDFNMGAMENKSLNIFNSKYVLAKPETATDDDYQAIEAVIGHEYFHNWTGNRVTCRDWFQLTLKEGLTVFRDQEFTSDMQSRAVKRIRDVRDLRNRQFPEDAGPMSHPIRPDEFVEINNFYTMTVYQKGATIVRMLHTLLGEAGFQQGMQLYFQRHDGEAVTCEDFLAAMADANNTSLEQFGRWYGQSGTTDVTAHTEYDQTAARYTLHLRQHTMPTHDQQKKQELVIPIAVGLLTPQGEQIGLRMAGEGDEAGYTRILLLEQQQQTFTFENVTCEPVPSLLRDFSAPVKLHYDYSASALAILMKHDPDAFVRWEAAQLLAQAEIMRNRQRLENGQGMILEPALREAFARLLNDTDSDPALLAEAMMLPGEDYLAEQMDVVDVDGIHTAHRFVKHSLAQALYPAFRANYDRLNRPESFAIDAASVAKRSLKNLCLSYLMELPEGIGIAKQQLERSDNMTDTLAVLGSMTRSGTEGTDAAMAAFESRWHSDPLVLDKWFALHATRPGNATLARVETLMGHPAFSLTNPNKVRALIGAFAMSNPTAFHDLTGAGYRFITDRIIELDGLNSQGAARLASAFNRWKRYDGVRQGMMRSQLQRLAGIPGLSSDVSEILANALED